MTNKPNLLTRFWNEIQRRKVMKVLAMYAGSAFIIIQVESSLADPLNLPRWVGTLIVIILSAGFPVTAVLAWIFDLTPEGITKTESYEESEQKEIIKTPSRRRLKASDIVMAIMAVVIVILAWPKIFGNDSIGRLRPTGGKLSVAVMPFKNMTNDTSWNIWQDGIQQRMISSLSNSGELQVRNKESIKTLLNSQELTQLASFSPAIAGKVSEKLDADIYVYGSIQKSGSEIGMDAQLIDTKTKEVIKSFEVKGPASESMMFPMADSIRNKVRDYLLIKKLIKENPVFQHFPILTNSPEAFRYFIYGINARDKGDMESAINWNLKALEADSSFADAAFNLENSYAYNNQPEKSKQWLIRNYERRDRMPYDCNIYASWAYAFSFESPDEQIKYLNQLLEIDNDQPSYHWLLGLTYNLNGRYDKAIPELQKLHEILVKWGKEFDDGSSYIQLGKAFHETKQFQKEKKNYKEFARNFPSNPWLFYRRAISYLSEKDTVSANKEINGLTAAIKTAWSSTDSHVASFLGHLYSEAGLNDKAELYLRKSIVLEPDNPELIQSVANFFIDTKRNLEEVAALMEKAMGLAKNRVDYYEYLNTKGWALYKQGRTKEAYEIIQKAWDEAPFKLYSIRSHFEEVEKAAKEQGIV